MFPKTERIQASERILFVLRQGRKFSSGSLTCYYLPSSANLKQTEGEPSLKAAVIISAKVAKQAVVRNRLRRQAFSVLESFRSTLKGDVIVRYLPGSAEMGFDGVRENISHCLQIITR